MSLALKQSVVDQPMQAAVRNFQTVCNLCPPRTATKVRPRGNHSRRRQETWNREHKPITGMLSVDALRSAVEDGSIDTVILGFPDPYGRLMGKRLDASFFLTDVAGGTHACDYLFTVDMEMEPVAGYEFSNWELGYGDVHLTPDLGTLRQLSWLDCTALAICDAQLDPGHEPVRVAPRSILRRQLERLQSHGFEAMAGSELEYFQYRTSYLDAARSGYRELTEVGWYLEDYHLLQGSRTEDLNGAYRRHLAASGVPVESTKGEFGRGQHELNIRYAPMLEMADRHLVLKQAVKEISDQLGCSATFMAKPDAAQAGSSCHLHVSLWQPGNGELNNAFPGDGKLNGIACSDLFRWFLGGLDALRAGADGVLRADGELVQAVPGRELGANGFGVVARQPHRRLSRRGQRGRVCG